ncbi:MAG TPA: type VI secretion system baseplate subunit TssK [Phycisphaerae bacterium]|nr:type VI secretion system baseplate subunit TssK [Phycisphaerae bacterium]
MNFWTEVHWSEGMFLRPHHLQAGQRWLENLVRTGIDSTRPFAWGFTELQVASEPLENFTLRLDRCHLRLKDGTWIRIPENTEVDPLNFKDSLEQGRGQLDVFLGIPAMQEVRANSVSLENPEASNGTPRFEPFPFTKRDENTGENPQIVYMRRIRGRLFTQFDDMTGFEIIRLGRIKRTDRAGALPEMDDLGAGPLLAVQSDAGISKMIRSLADQIEAKDEVLAREAKEHRMMFTDGVAANTEHLLKLHVLNEVRAGMKAMMQCPVLHPFEIFSAYARLVGHLSVFHDDLVPMDIPAYDHDRPTESLERLRARIVVLLEAMRPIAYVERPFSLKKDETGREGLEVELDRKWIDDNSEMFVALISDELDINELYNHIYQKLDMKLASPTRSRKIHNIAVRGLGLQIKSVPAGVLPRRQSLHYFKVDKTIGPDRTDYWKECEQERGIRMSIREGQLPGMTRFKPALYVVTK